MEVKAQFGNQSLGVHSGATKLLKTGESAQTPLNNTRASLWILPEVPQTLLSERKVEFHCLQPGKSRISAPGRGTGYIQIKITIMPRFKCVNAIIL